MSDLNTEMVEKYRNSFLKEVEANVEEGDWVKMCMQCGVCAGSCPFGPYWDHPPQEIFMMIRAGKREEVLSSTSMWMCTSCYNCIARCPRELPITHIMHGLAHYGKRLGLAPKNQPTMKVFTEILGQPGERRSCQRVETWLVSLLHEWFCRRCENSPEDEKHRSGYVENQTHEPHGNDWGA